jgi:hypothetical protein
MPAHTKVERRERIGYSAGRCGKVGGVTHVRKCLATLALVAIVSPVMAAEVTGVAVGDDVIAVRHDAAQPGEPVVTLRHFKIRKGSFAEFLAASEQGVWPFFEKIGARVVGMWQVVHPTDAGPAASTATEEYDEVWLMTRYASVEHWRATRDMARLGGNGPDYHKAIEALRRRNALTLGTDLRFLQGTTWQNPPFFMPSVD